MAKLKKNHKTFIVEQLACFEPPSKIVEQLKETFGVIVSFAQVAYYNPEGSQGSRELARKWRHLFNETRDTFIAESGSIPISHKNYRLNELYKNYQRLIGKGNITEACNVLEQAAREMGGAYNSNGALVAPATQHGNVNFYQQINQKILERDQKAANTNGA